MKIIFISEQNQRKAERERERLAVFNVEKKLKIQKFISSLILSPLKASKCRLSLRCVSFSLKALNENPFSTPCSHVEARCAQKSDNEDERKFHLKTNTHTHTLNLWMMTMMILPCLCVCVYFLWRPCGI
jgi:hypothetical protein